MNVGSVQDALSRVRKLQEIILAKRFFGGYSGRARFGSGCIALIGATLMDKPFFPTDAHSHLWGWGVVVVLCVILNYGTLLYWFLSDPEANRKPLQLKPALYAFPAFAVGAVFSLLFIRNELFDYLPGMWMCLYGLAQVTYRQTLPIEIFYTGLGYIFCGTYFLLMGNQPFTIPWPMGIVFFIGETIGGWYLLNDKADQKETL